MVYILILTSGRQRGRRIRTCLRHTWREESRGEEDSSERDGERVLGAARRDLKTQKKKTCKSYRGVGPVYKAYL